MNFQLHRGQVICSRNGIVGWYYLVMNPGKDATMIIDLTTKSEGELLGIMSDIGYMERSFIGTIRPEGMIGTFSFIPSFRPVPNEFLTSDDMYIAGEFTSDDFRSFTLKLRGILGGFLYRKPNQVVRRADDYWTDERRKQFLEDCSSMSAKEISEKYEIEEATVDAFRRKFDTDLSQGGTVQTDR